MMKNRFLIVLIPFVLFSCAYYTDDIIDHLNNAEKDFNAHHWQKAIKEYKTIRKNYPSALIDERIAYSYFHLSMLDSTKYWLKKCYGTTKKPKYKIQLQAIEATKILASYYKEQATLQYYIIKKSNYINSDPSLMLTLLKEAKEDDLFEISKSSIDSLFIKFSQTIPNHKFGRKAYNLEKTLKDVFVRPDSLSFKSDSLLSDIHNSYKKYRYKKKKFPALEQALSSDSLSKYFELEGYLEDTNNLMSEKELRNLFLDTTLSTSFPNLAIIAETIGATTLADSIYQTIHYYNEPTVLKNAALFYIRKNNWNEADKFLGALSLLEKHSFSNRLRFYQEILKKDYQSARDILEAEIFNPKERTEMQFLLSIAEKKYFKAAAYAPKLEKNNSSLLAFAFLGVPEVVTEFYVTRLNPTNSGKMKSFFWPLESIRITSRYGWRPGPKYRNWTKRLRNMDYHYGIDLGAPTGTPVLAAAEGVVIQTDTLTYAGKAVKIKHKNKYSTVYYHLHKISIAKGDTVQALQKIGEVGNTGRSFGAHLHFGIINPNGKSENPLLYLAE